MPAAERQRQSSEPGNERSQKGYAIESRQLASTKPPWKHSPFHRSLRWVSYLCGLPSQKCLLPNTICLGLTNALPVFWATPFLVSNSRKEEDQWAQPRSSGFMSSGLEEDVEAKTGNRSLPFTQWHYKWCFTFQIVSLLKKVKVSDQSCHWFEKKNSDQEGHFYSQININYSRHASRFYLLSSLGQGVINSIKKDKGVT